MGTNVYAPKDCDLSQWGFRWCNKDQRWERRKTMEDGDAKMLAAEIGHKVEVKSKNGTVLTHSPIEEE